MKQCLSITLLAFTTLFASFWLMIPAYAEDHHAKAAKFSVKEIKPNLYFLQGRGGNIAVLKTDEGLAMIDGDYQDMTPALEQALASIGGKLTHIINTHWHGDHTQGNLHFGHQAHSIIAHENVYERLSSKQTVKLFNMVSEAYPKHARPNISYDKLMRVRLGDETLKIQHFAKGHTDGDSIIFFGQANAVHMGDHFFNGFFPFVDVSSKGSVQGMIDNISAVLQMINEDTIVIPGHGPVANKADLKAFQSMLVGTQAEVQEQIKAGKSLKQIQAKGLNKKWQVWTKGFLPEKVWIQIVHASLNAA